MASSDTAIKERRKLCRAQQLGSHKGLCHSWVFTDPDRLPLCVDDLMSMPAGWGVVYRHFGARDRLEQAYALLQAARRCKLTFLVSADDALRALPCDGFHWPRSRRPARLPLWAQRYTYNTTSAHTHLDIYKAKRFDADICFLSSVFPSQSPSAPSAMGPLRFREFARTSQIQIAALGGVAGSNVNRLQGRPFALVGAARSLTG